MKFHDILLQMDIFKTILSSIDLEDITNVPYYSSKMVLEEKQNVFTFKKSFEVAYNDLGPSKAQIILYGAPPGSTTQLPSSGSNVIPNANTITNTFNNNVSTVFEFVLKFSRDKLISVAIQKPSAAFTISLETLSKPLHYIYFSGTNLLYNDAIISCIGETEALFHSDIMNEEINLSEMISFKGKIDEILKLKVL